MSISQITKDNDIKLFVNTTDRGIDLNGTIFTSSGSPYRFILPVNTPNNVNSILAVASLVDDNILTHWIDPTGGPTIPIDTINCNILNALLEVNTAQLEVNNQITGGSVQFIMNSSNNTQYTLPNNYPSQNGQVLSSQTNGVMSWVPFPTFPTVPAYRKKFTNIAVNLTKDSPSHVIQYNPNFLLNIGTTYKLTSTFTYRKQAGTSFSIFNRVIPITGATIITEAMVTNNSAIANIDDGDGNNVQNFQNTYWFVANFATTTWEIQAESGAVAGGVVRWDLVEMVFEPTFTLIQD